MVMRDNNAGTPAHLKGYIPQVTGAASGSQDAGSNREEGSCRAFGFLRGLNAHAMAVEFRLRSGNSEWFSYSCLVSWRHNPSVGLLLKFTTGDGMSLVLIQGSNLEAPVDQAQINLTDYGLQRHRINYIREMDEDELSKAHQRGEPTVDGIDIAEFETTEEQRQWLKARAPAFVRKQA